jgi:hypothetical protein
VKRALAVFALLCGCAAPRWQQAPHDRLHQRAPNPILHAPVGPSESSTWWDALSNGAIRPLSRAVSPARWLDEIAGGREALDVNAFGQVLESSWFTPRIGRYALTPEEVVRGGDTISGPASAPWIVIGGKVEGATPGLIMQDVDGNTFVVKFDPPAFPELASAAELITTKILWAAGYHVPENYLGKCNLRWLQLSPTATTRGDYGETVPLDASRLAAILAHVNPVPDGTVRALFSRYLPGLIIGHGSFRGRRSGDPNDTIPHQDRRSLRGLWLFSAWLNNTDTRDGNTLDVFHTTDEEKGIGYIQHYLLDFGDSLGSAGTRSKYIGEGYEYRVDWDSIFSQLFSLGLYYPYWLPVRRAPLRSVGVFESDVFDPATWRPNLPNPAFEAATPLDDYWAGSIIARFTPEILAEIVELANYSEPGAAEHVLRVLIERRQKVLRHAFSRVLALDDPRSEGLRLALTDLERETGLVAGTAARLSWTLLRDGTAIAAGEVDAPEIDLTAPLRAQGDFGKNPFVSVRFVRSGQQAPAVTVHLRVLDRGLLPIALDREVD